MTANNSSDSDSDSVDASHEVLTQLETIRVEGFCNMLDVGCVRDAAQQIGFTDLVAWIDAADRGEYGELVTSRLPYDGAEAEQ